MITSRVLSLVIRRRILVKLINSPQIGVFNYSLIKTKPTVVLQELKTRKMSSNVDAEANDPNRHFDYNQLKKKMENKNVVVIDVREHSEVRETGKIPGSIHIPLGELSKALGSMPTDEFKKEYNASKPRKDNEIIFSCKSGVRSFKALNTALQLGYTNAGHYKGGWLDWSEHEKS